MATKSFCKELHSLNDMRGKSAARLFLLSLEGVKEATIIQEDIKSSKYRDIDVTIDNNLTFGVEVLIKKCWKTNKKFPYSTIDIEARKLKKQYDNVKYFIVLSDDLLSCMMISGKVFRKSPFKIKNTKYTVNEEFISINIEKSYARGELSLFKMNKYGKWSPMTNKELFSNGRSNS